MKISFLVVLATLIFSSLVGCGASTVQSASINPASQQEGEQRARAEIARSEQERRARLHAESGASEAVSAEASGVSTSQETTGSVAISAPPPTATVSAPPPPVIPSAPPVIIAQQPVAVMMPSPMIGVSSPYPSMGGGMMPMAQTAPMAVMLRRPADPRCQMYIPGFAYAGAAASKVCGKGGSHCTRLKISRFNEKVMQSQFVSFSYKGADVPICLPGGEIAGGALLRLDAVGNKVVVPTSLVRIPVVDSDDVWIATPASEVGDDTLKTTYSVNATPFDQYATAVWVGYSPIGFRYTSTMLPKLSMHPALDKTARR